jgi:calcium-dependent protein kinase
MDICTGGELLEAILKAGHLDESTAADYMRQILSTLIYLHSQKIIHRDLKLENMLIDEPGSNNLKLIDFGAATFYKKDDLQSLRVGTVNYIAPEVLNKKYNEKCDVWSAGVILYVLLSGKLPFRGSSKMESIRFIKEGRFSLQGGVWDLVSEDAKDLIKKLLDNNPKTRLSAQQAFNHPWIQRSKLPALKNNLLEIVSSNLKTFHLTSKLQRAVIRFIACQLLTSVEKKELNEIYKYLDAEGHGKISKDQLSTFWMKILGNRLEEDEVSGMMTRLDTDKNGFVEYSEFIVAAMDKKKLLSSERLDAVFNAFDKDHNGKISAFELYDMLDDHQELEMNLYQNVIKEADLNGDGQVDFTEFKKLMFCLVNS